MIIVVTNRKGGVGKTTSTTWLAVGMAARGYRIGIVDSDSQGNIALNFGLPASNGLFDVLVGELQKDGKYKELPLTSVVVEIDRSKMIGAAGALFVLPGFHKTAKIAAELGGEGQLKFLAMCEQFKSEYHLDYLFIDTQPSITDADGSIYLAADGYILVTEAEKASIDGIVNVYEQIGRTRMLRQRFLQRETRLLGVLPNKVRNTTNCEAAMKRLREDFPDELWTPIPLATSITEAFSDEHTPLTYPKAQSSVDPMWLNIRRLEALCQT